MPECIYRAKERFNNHGMEFAIGDVFKVKLPEADLLLAKDVFMHWHNDEIFRFLPILSNFKYSLVTNRLTNNNAINIREPEKSLNGIISESNLAFCRPLDLTLPPFSLPGTLVAIYYFQEFAYNGVYLFTGDEIKKHLENKLRP